VFLDISWIRSKLPDAEERIKKKLPSMYHQFKQLADIDITQEPMEVGPTTHYMMGGIRVDAETQMSTVPGLFAAGECAAGLHGANRLGGNSLSDLLVFGKRAGTFAARYARERSPSRPADEPVEAAIRRALKPFDSPTGKSEGPYAIQQELQGMMQDLVGIVRQEAEMGRALEGIARLKESAARVRVGGNRQFNPGWHTALDLRHLLIVSEAITRSALERKESRGAHFREDYPKKDPEAGKVNLVVRRADDGSMRIERRPIPEMQPDLKSIIEENS
jgi:succinate dehydrogenase flavoprotein subunit